MNRAVFKYVVFLLTMVCCLAVQSAGDPQSKADLAVANILFEYDSGSEFASYRVNKDGFVDLIMAKNTPNEVYGEILIRIQNHPDVDGVLASKTGTACKISHWN